MKCFIKCFKYLNAFDLFYSFDELNSRLNNLIRNVRLYINFENVNKTIFDKFCSKMLIDSNIRNQIYSIEILNDDHCFQCNLFFSSFPPNTFPNLQRFTSIYPLSKERKDPWIYERNIYSGSGSSKNDDYNIHLKIKQSDLPLSQLRTLSILNLYSLKSNIHQISSIINLTISKFYFKDSQCLFNNLPMLKYLHIKSYDYNQEKDPNILSNHQHSCHLKQLIIDQFDVKFESFEIFVKQTPNLESLTFISDNNQDRNITDANRWEYLIRSSLPKLNTFNFKYSYYESAAYFQSTHQGKINRFEQFQSDFWKEQHHWCFEYIQEDHSISIYTIPYVSDTYKLQYNFTNSSNNLVNTFVNVKNLILKRKQLVENSKYYFPNVTSLKLTTDYSDTFPTTEHIPYLKMMINLFKLKHLGIPDNENKDASFLLEIFKQTPQLSSISISPNYLKEILNIKDIFEYFTKMIKNFNFTEYNTKIDNYFKMEDFCTMLPNIEHLQCLIYDTKNLFVIIDNLPKLSTLKITDASGSNSYESGSGSDGSAAEPQEEFLKFINEASKRNITYDINVHRIEGDERYGRYTPNYLFFTTLFIWIDNKHTLN